MVFTTFEFDVRSFEAKNRVFEFDYQKMNTFESVQCQKIDVWVHLMFDKMRFDTSLKSGRSIKEEEDWFQRWITCFAMIRFIPLQKLWCTISAKLPFFGVLSYINILHYWETVANFLSKKRIYFTVVWIEEKLCLDKIIFTDNSFFSIFGEGFYRWNTEQLIKMISCGYRKISIH